MCVCVCVCESFLIIILEFYNYSNGVTLVTREGKDIALNIYFDHKIIKTHSAIRWHKTLGVYFEIFTTTNVEKFKIICSKS